MTGLFVGLSTLDFLYLCDRVPQRNEKRVALAQLMAAGGPATNAALTFRHWGQPTQLLASLGGHPLAQLIHQELRHHGVELIDLDPTRLDPPPVSSIMITQDSGERAVISINATQTQARLDPIPDHLIPEHLLEGVEIVLIDGHQIGVSVAIATWAKALGIPIVVDGGSWKVGFEAVLRQSDYVIASRNFMPPGCGDQSEVMDYLRSLAIPQFAISQGENPLLYEQFGERGEIPMIPIRAIDTLGAGDVLHGAFCHFILYHPFQKALQEAAAIASLSCQDLGTRGWRDRLNAPSP